MHQCSRQHLLQIPPGGSKDWDWEKIMKKKKQKKRVVRVIGKSSPLLLVLLSQEPLHLLIFSYRWSDASSIDKSGWRIFSSFFLCSELEAGLQTSLSVNSKRLLATGCCRSVLLSIQTTDCLLRLLFERRKLLHGTCP
jgi:hypothetical protein